MKKALVYSNNPLIADWICKSAREGGWSCEISDGTKKPDALAIVEVSRQIDVKILQQCMSVYGRCVVYSSQPIARLLMVLQDFDVLAYIRPGSSASSLIDSLESAHEGKEYYDEKVITYILSNKYKAIYENIRSLSKRELEIIDCIMDDMTNDEIAEKYVLSVRTVNAHKRNILQKMKARSLVGVTKTMLTYTLRYT